MAAFVALQGAQETTFFEGGYFFME